MIVCRLFPLLLLLGLSQVSEVSAATKCLKGPFVVATGDWANSHAPLSDPANECVVEVTFPATCGTATEAGAITFEGKEVPAGTATTCSFDQTKFTVPYDGEATDFESFLKPLAIGGTCDKDSQGALQYQKQWSCTLHLLPGFSTDLADSANQACADPANPSKLKDDFEKRNKYVLGCPLLENKWNTYCTALVPPPADCAAENPNPVQPPLACDTGVFTAANAQKVWSKLSPTSGEKCMVKVTFPPTCGTEVDAQNIEFKGELALATPAACVYGQNSVTVEYTKGTPFEDFLKPLTLQDKCDMDANIPPAMYNELWSCALHLLPGFSTDLVDPAKAGCLDQSTPPKLDAKFMKKNGQVKGCPALETRWTDYCTTFLKPAGSTIDCTPKLPPGDLPPPCDTGVFKAADAANVNVWSKLSPAGQACVVKVTFPQTCDTEADAQNIQFEGKLAPANPVVCDYGQDSVTVQYTSGDGIEDFLIPYIIEGQCDEQAASPPTIPTAVSFHRQWSCALHLYNGFSTDLKKPENQLCYDTAKNKLKDEFMKRNRYVKDCPVLETMWTAYCPSVSGDPTVDCPAKPAESPFPDAVTTTQAPTRPAPSSTTLKSDGAGSNKNNNADGDSSDSSGLPIWVVAIIVVVVVLVVVGIVGVVLHKKKSKGKKDKKDAKSKEKYKLLPLSPAAADAAPKSAQSPAANPEGNGDQQENPV